MTPTRTLHLAKSLTLQLDAATETVRVLGERAPDASRQPARLHR